MNKKYFKRYFILLIIVLSVGLTSCSNESKQRINIEPDELKFNDEASDSMSIEFATIFYDVTGLYIKWYNASIKEPNNEDSIVLKEYMDEIVLNDMQDMLKEKLMNEYEKKIYKQCLDLGLDMQVIRLQNIKIEKEELLREKSLKELSDKEFDKVKNNRKQDLIEIKESIMDILEKYYNY